MNLYRKFLIISSIVLLMTTTSWGAIPSTSSCSQLVIHYGAGETVVYDKTNYVKVVELYYGQDRLEAVKVGLSNGSCNVFFDVKRIDVLVEQFDPGWDNPKLTFIRKTVGELLIPE